MIDYAEYIVTIPNGVLTNFLKTDLGKTLLNSGRVLQVTDVSNPSDYYLNESVTSYFPTPSSLRYMLAVLPQENNTVKNNIIIRDVYTQEEWSKQQKYK